MTRVLRTAVCRGGVLAVLVAGLLTGSLAGAATAAAAPFAAQPPVPPTPSGSASDDRRPPVPTVPDRPGGQVGAGAVQPGGTATRTPATTRPLGPIAPPALGTGDGDTAPPTAATPTARGTGGGPGDPAPADATGPVPSPGVLDPPPSGPVPPAPQPGGVSAPVAAAVAVGLVAAVGAGTVLLLRRRRAAPTAALPVPPGVPLPTTGPVALVDDRPTTHLGRVPYGGDPETRRLDPATEVLGEPVPPSATTVNVPTGPSPGAAGRTGIGRTGTAGSGTTGPFGTGAHSTGPFATGPFDVAPRAPADRVVPPAGGTDRPGADRSGPGPDRVGGAGGDSGISGLVTGVTGIGAGPAVAALRDALRRLASTAPSAAIGEQVHRLLSSRPDGPALVEAAIRFRDLVAGRHPDAADALLVALERADVVEVRAEGEAFDARRHDAVDTVPAEHPGQHDRVATTLRPGYLDRRSGRVLRLPSVTVHRAGP